MQLETFRGPALRGVLAEVRAALGEDAMILRTRGERHAGPTAVEVVAVSAREIELFRARLERRHAAAGVPAGREAGRPYVVALVGPTGAGKTTTIAKLAVNPTGFGGRRIGLVTLDTYRVGALDQLQTYAEIVGLPLEVVYSEAEVEGALGRLRGCDVVLVDTPGRSPRALRQNLDWRALLQRIAPDEIHLVLPASLRTDIALANREAFGACGLTHALLTKLDEVPHEAGVAELADLLGMPARWVCAGQEVPDDLHAAAPRLLASLCMQADAAVPFLAAR